jgi:hypothetical protein
MTIAVGRIAPAAAGDGSCNDHEVAEQGLGRDIATVDLSRSGVDMSMEASWANPVILGRMLTTSCRCRAAMTSAWLGRQGRGPTRLISPRTTLNSWGQFVPPEGAQAPADRRDPIVSDLVRSALWCAEGRGPELVTLGFSARPTRVWTNNAPSGEDLRTRYAMISIAASERSARKLRLQGRALVLWLVHDHQPPSADDDPHCVRHSGGNGTRAPRDAG